MGAMEENYQAFVPITSKNSASVCGICMVGERGDLPDSLMGALGHWPGMYIYLYSTPLQYHLGRVPNKILSETQRLHNSGEKR
jgi:hypothetical protein